MKQQAKLKPQDLIKCEYSLDKRTQQLRVETSGVIEKEQGNGFYLVTRAAGWSPMPLPRRRQAHQVHIKLLAGDKVLVEISPYDLSRGRITYERNAGGPPRRR